VFQQPRAKNLVPKTSCQKPPGSKTRSSHISFRQYVLERIEIDGYFGVMMPLPKVWSPVPVNEDWLIPRKRKASIRNSPFYQLTNQIDRMASIKK
jgi:hypothetical protein